MRAIPESFDSEVVEEIDRRLDRVEVDQHVAIPWCIESGSRAWGFPSPDSDYDARFFFVRSEEAYLTPWPARDVIETPLDKVFDVNGWDVRKAVQLLVKGNAVAVEWLRSPFVYRGSSTFRDELLALADEVADRSAIGRHYTHICVGQWNRHGGQDEILLKRLFYALRPAASLRWLESHPGQVTPPMELGPLLEQSGASRQVVALVEELVEVKSRTREMGRGPVPAPLAAYVEAAISYGLASFESRLDRPTTDHRGRAAEVFRHLVRSHGPRPTRGGDEKI